MDPNRSLSARIRAGFRQLCGLIYQPQVKLLFPKETIERRFHGLPPPPAGYVVRGPEGERDYAPWAALLNEDGGFGAWNAERIRVDIISGLIAPDAATLVFHGNELIGCGNTCRLPTRRGRQGIGMFLHIRRSHRRSGRLASIIIWTTLWFFVRERYDRAIATTDPWRHAALFIYLREGAIPIRDSLFSYWQWYQIERRLRPTLARWHQGKALAESRRG